MKRLVKITAALLTLIMLAVVFTFTAAADTALSDVQKNAVSSRVLSAVREYVSEIDVSDLNISTSQDLSLFVSDNFSNIYNTECFHISTFSMHTSGDKYKKISFQYSMEKQAYLERRQKLDKATEKYLEGLDHPDLDDVEKALILHDRLAKNVEYCTSLSSREPDFYRDIYTGYYPLVEGTGVCQGYSCAYAYLLSRVGIKSRHCISSKLNHMWTIVYIDGVAYHVDVTFDDPVGGGPDYVGHSNFLLSTDTLKSHFHDADDYDTEPQDTRYENAPWTQFYNEFFVNDGALFNSNDKKAVKLDSGAETVVFKAKQYTFRDIHGNTYTHTPYLEREGDCVYTNDAYNIYRYSFKTGRTDTVLQPDVGNGYISFFSKDHETGDFVIYIDCKEDDRIVVKKKPSDLSPIASPRPDPEPHPLPSGGTPPENTNGFLDVVAGKWYCDAIDYTYSRGFISGMSATEFGVSTQVSRAMFVTILARIAGVDTGSNDVATRFSDVERNRYYTSAIRWANEKDIVAGMSDTTFCPNTPIQRQQLCVMIVNFARHIGAELSPVEGEIAFSDSAAIANYAKAAVKTAQTADVVNGYAAGDGFEFKPTNTATRAEAAHIIYKFHKDFVA